jgi:hypothetical protein
MWFILKSSEKLNHTFSSTACIHMNRAGMMTDKKCRTCGNNILAAEHLQPYLMGLFLMTINLCSRLVRTMTIN